ncbi:DNA polymerase III subunit delta' [Mycoplasmoides pneumoniae]|uniref:DNA polymerase III subunit delta' n=1 Tax=Mycoplasmoides pneumoniae TaxID=2104 RepID=UPI001375BEAA|nr:DNA polymerase III subunit delta' [Mycoplasmoides pneumoniae]QHR04975.1 DNA polymerase III subunit delta' [Mycoplasmoides pneumoniae]QHR09185.1 DNA polymerase III subunit delta' [Mycoplasmoides pneumoniae]GLL58157.1 hypothetical protein Y1241N_2040 [Mycoplasmoides pneumoniae]GLL60218.1 hypothetical protein OA571N_1000 [Mycoplasmoides pneumoniae]
MFNPTHALLIIQRRGSYLQPVLTEYLTRVVCEQQTGCQTCPSCLEILHGTYNNFYSFDQANPFKREHALHLSEVLNRQSESNQKQLYLIKNLETLTATTMNSLLRLIEEHPVNTYGVFTTKNENMILPTILSRVQKVVLKKATQLPFQVDSKDQAILKSFFSVDEQLQALDNGSFTRLKTIITTLTNKKNTASTVHEAWVLFKQLNQTETAQVLNFMVDYTKDLTKKDRLLNMVQNLVFNPPKAALFANLINW